MYEIYEVPELEVLNVMIEKGFAASPGEGAGGNESDGEGFPL